MSFTTPAASPNPGHHTTVTAATYTAVRNDVVHRGGRIICNRAGGVALTIPPDVFATGDVLDVLNIGAGDVDFAAGAGVTLTQGPATDHLSQYFMARLIFTAPNAATITGPLDAS